ncbi:glycosyltransferase family 4 protein [Streptacidiphilus sp. EB129]|uniref:glycosyltransferase family 4 protein n=1 Tax=Streptacidiphilus sp. EB129 TaxID=3156262 RepID=UPI003511E8D1
MTRSSAPPLRLLLLAPAGSAHTRRWADALAALGHAVTVCSWHDPDLDRSATTWRLSSAPAGAWWPWRVLRATGWLRREVRRTRPDVIHVHSLGVHGALSLALPTRTAPLLVTPWGSELRAADRHPGRALVARLALHRAARVLPTSREVAAKVANRYRITRSRITVLSWGVPDALLDGSDGTDARLTRARFGIAADATVVLSVRTTSPVYRTQEILDAFAHAAKVRPDLHLVLLTGHQPAKPGPARAQQHYLATLRAGAAHLADRITVIDQLLGQAELFALMRASEVAVSVPHADQRSSSVLEAAAAGCRLLLADIPPYRELVADGLHADLLPDPLHTTLADTLTAAAPLPSAERAANRELISRTERGSVQVAQLERLYRDMTRPGPGTRQDPA